MADDRPNPPTAELKIKRCMFCREDAVIETISSGFGNRRVHWVECTVCGGRGPIKASILEAVSAWNNASFAEN